MDSEHHGGGPRQHIRVSTQGALRSRRRSDPDSAAAPAASGGRIDAVDGLRALAVIAVVAFHFGAPLPGGFLGVDLFFVISGFVITRLLIRRHATGSRLEYGRFLARRVRRLLPALVVVLAATMLWLLTTDQAMQRAGDKQIVAAAGYVSNWYAIFGKQSYWDVHSELTPLNHLWSLSVEEQFYLLWPWLVVLLLTLVPRRARPALVLAGAAVSYGLAFWLGMGHAERAYLGTDTRAGALLLGAALALFLDGPRSRRRSTSRDRRIVTAVGVSALVAFTAACAIGWTVDSPALYAGGLLLVGVSEAALVWSVLHRGVLARVFGSPVLRAVGRASYSIYLWHWLLWVVLCSTPTVPELWRPALAIAGTAVLSAVTYRCVELPLQRRAPRAVVACSLAALAALAVCALVLLPPEGGMGWPGGGG